ncbi:DinB family protein [Spirosoma arcticum]
MTSVNLTPITQFLTSGRAFVNFANGLSEARFSQQANGKWSVGDTMQHLFLSARPVARLMTGPRDAFRQWGHSDGSSRSYDEIADLYRRTLATGLKSPATLSPRSDDVHTDRATVVARFTDAYESLATAAGGWSADELDRYVMPHPALGIVTVREMLDFTDIHTRHHLSIVQAQQL